MKPCAWLEHQCSHGFLIILLFKFKERYYRLCLFFFWNHFDFQEVCYLFQYNNRLGFLQFSQTRAFGYWTIWIYLVEWSTWFRNSYNFKISPGVGHCAFIMRSGNHFFMNPYAIQTRASVLVYYKLSAFNSFCSSSNTLVLSEQICLLGENIAGILNRQNFLRTTLYVWANLY